MELKSYQKKTMRNLSSYLTYVNEDNDIIKAWQDYWKEQDINVGMGGVPNYNNAISSVPHICMKVPTGGGKTFMACASIKEIYDSMPLDKYRVIVWLVPSDSILQQTIKTLSDVNHPYRQRLERDFAGRVGIYTKEMLLNGQNFSPDTVREMLTICILSYSSLRINSKKKDVRKVYQENGNLFRFAEYFKDNDVLLADTPDSALIQVLRYLSPVTIVDESHNAGSDLSIEMLKNLNPSLVLDLTATPRTNSNIISYVDARELKKESMVKLPVVVYNRTTRQSVIQDAIQLRGCIEQQAIAEEKAGGHYIRPILLFQAQPKTNDDSETFDKIKNILIEMGINKEQIAIKTSKVDELANTNLLSKDCPIRYIITVNALKEGWDCPFAYILASLANKTSTVDVEQILGRILRQPYTKQHSASLLNTSYVLTCSNDFHNTLKNIVLGLNKAGFSKKDFRVGEIEENPIESTIEEHTHTQTTISLQPETSEKDTFSDVTPAEVRNALEKEGNSGESSSTVNNMVEIATQQAENYNETANHTDDSEFLGGEIGDMLQKNEMQPQFREEAEKIRVPQFFLKTTPDLFGGEYELLEPENLSEGFSLSEQDANVSFELAIGEMYCVDIPEQGEAVPKYKRVSKNESAYIREYLAKFPPEKKIEHCAKMICCQINKNNRYATSDVYAYVHRIVSNMKDDEIAAMETAISVYVRKIQQKIESLENGYREQQFFKWLDSGKIVCLNNYILPKVITPAYTIDSIPYSLYEAEKDDMNNFEQSLIDVVVGFKNIKWWHRIIDRKGFRLNGYMNHYPDFIVMTKSNNIILLEAKGDYLDGDDSKSKLKLGRQWQAHAGQNYRYFMVFKDKEIGIDGAYTIDKFADVMRNL